jgi:hypothetical protein
MCPHDKPLLWPQLKSRMYETRQGNLLVLIDEVQTNNWELCSYHELVPIPVDEVQPNKWELCSYRGLVVLLLWFLVLIRYPPVLLKIVKHVDDKRVVLVQSIAIGPISCILGLLFAPSQTFSSQPRKHTLSPRNTPHTRNTPVTMETSTLDVS